MARKPALLELLIWTLSIPIASCHSRRLGGDIASLVPTCAQPCLESFIRSNYPTVDCGTNFTLPCLCPAQSLTGFTVGEAALQCLLGYVQIGRCDEKDAEGPAPARVLNICSGQENALPNTHPTLTATLIVPPSGVPILLPPTSTPTTLPTSSTTSSTVRSTQTTFKTTTRTTASLTTSTPSSISSSSIFSSSISSSVTTTMVMSSLLTSTSFSSPTLAPTSSPTAEPSSGARLAPGQIVGISVGVAGAIAIAAGSIFLARCLRRRKYPDSESEKPLYQNDNTTDGPDLLGSRGSRIFHVSPPILRTSKYRPDFFSRPTPVMPQTDQPEPPTQSANIDRNTIGLAISRPRSFIPPKPSPNLFSSITSKPSKLLPPRPALTLDIPSTTVPTDRTSTVTNLTGFADLDSEAAEGGQTWRPPPTDPQSATTNNNRRSQIAQIVEAAELDTYTPMTKSPVEKREEAARMTDAISAAAAIPKAPQPAFLSRDPTNWTYSQSSSAYSQASAVRQIGRRNSSRNSTSRAQKNGGGPLINRSDSKASATTIQTSSTGGNEDGPAYENDIARLSQLSPVAESPNIASRRSRVNYPKFSGRLDGATIRYVPPPKKPNFTGSLSDQASPTLGVVYPVEGSPSAIPLPLNPRRKERRFVPMQRDGSGFTPEPPNVEVFPIQNFARPNEISNSGPYLRADYAAGQPTEPYSYGDDYQQRNPFLTPPQPPYPTFTPSPPSPSPPEPAEKRAVSPQQSSIMNRGRPHITSQRAESGTSFGTVSSNASSLLAKRLGTDRAAALVIDPYSRKAQQWRQQGGGINNGDFLSPDAYSLASPKGTLPQTPIWQPKLTPTRRGDDLFLNVQ
ncbi:hypothetical protein F5B22DRAFT_637066 [Xylaria bambusicola]|uniref:uncharacterized protein n=1 Tax=Xylaria bambusicola TaxID=326684 RepID=UPI0020077E47|nr:uncharacterized protein F5B22DRAFT_637066 [Xylaria bambusicola]KAI0514511.1 hypothetical protein F5B22DRAFT_637066 [Xylaria bambusicola]